MQHYWRKWQVCATILVCCVGLSACQATTPVYQMMVPIDQAKTMEFAYTERGAMPADDGVYRVENMGLMLYRQDDGQLVYAWDVMVNVTQEPVKRIQVAQVLNNGKLQIVLTDAPSEAKHHDAWQRLPTGGRSQLFAQRWRGVSAAQNALQARWLQDGSESILVFKIEIESQSGRQHVLYQPMMVSEASKQRYIQVLQQP